MNKIKFIIFILLAFAISATIMLLNKDNSRYYEATSAYRVYLNGKSLGLIASEEELEKYINNEQQEIKEKLGVENVYAPQGLKVREETTYNNKIKDTKQIYEEIKEKGSFTVDGYQIELTKNTNQGIDESSAEEDNYIEKTKIYVLDLDMFKESVDKVVRSFVDEEAYDKYLNNTQDKIITTGSTIENVYIENDFVIKYERIPIDQYLFTNGDDLTAFLLFGTTDKQKTYIVKSGDTIESISGKNKMSTNEFLIANPAILSEDALLYTGQEVIIGLIDPMFSVIEERYEVAKESLMYQTEVKVNNNLVSGSVKIIREGSEGSAIVTKTIKYSNNEIVDAVTISTEITKESVNRIVEKTTGTSYVVGDVGVWKWPTKIPYIISSKMGWRRGSCHWGIDICGTGGTGSPIYAANSGTVELAGWGGTYGYLIIINHNNGFKTRYAHLSKIYVKVGDGVEMGEVIALMGNTGRSTGTHLHFEVRYYGEDKSLVRTYSTATCSASSSGDLVNPFDLYR